MYMYMHDITYVCHKHTFPTTNIIHLLTKRNNPSSLKSLSKSDLTPHCSPCVKYVPVYIMNAKLHMS